MTTQKKPGIQSSESVRRAGFKNILISVFVAGTTYYSLTLIAKDFGGSLGSDAYFFLTSLVTMASGLIGSILGTVFLPALIKLLTQGRTTEAGHFACSIFSWCVLFSCALALPIGIWNELFFLKISRFNASEISEMQPVLQYFAIIFMCSVLTEFFRVLALTLGKFSMAALAAAFPPLFLIVFLFCFGSVLHEEALAMSFLSAKAVALIMLIVVTWRLGFRMRFSLRRNPHALDFVKTSAPYWSANIVTNTANFYFDYMASGLGTGVVSAIAYAQRIFALPITLFLNPIVEIARTKFAQLQSATNYNSLNNYYNSLIKLALYFTVPISALYILFSQDIISAMFQRGEFQANNVLMAGSCLGIYALSLPLVAIFTVNGRASESYQRLLWPSVFGTIGNLLLIIATYFFVARLGYQGIPIAKLAIDTVYMLPFGFASFMLFGGRPNYREIGRAIVFTLSSAFITGFFFHILNVDDSYDGTQVPFHLMISYTFGFLAVYSLIFFSISSDVRKEFKNAIAIKKIPSNEV